MEMTFGPEFCSVCGNPKISCVCGHGLVDDYTRVAEMKAKEKDIYSPSDENAPHGYIYGRRIIGRDTEINGGAYVANGEAIVVDDEKYELTESCWTEIKAELDARIARGLNHKDGIFRLVNDLVRKKMPYNLKAVEKIDDRITKKHSGWYKVSLDLFLDARAGVCRHQALLAGYLFEKMTKETYISPENGRPIRYLRGKASVERNWSKKTGTGHAWTKYVAKSGDVVIVDPANNFISTFDRLEEERLKRKNAGMMLWYYEGVSRDDPEEEIISGPIFPIPK